MRYLWAIIFAGLLTLPASATIACVQGATGCTNTTVRSCTMSAVTSCSITVASTGAGDTGIACLESDNTSDTFTVTGAGTWTTDSGSLGTVTSTVFSECAHNTNLTGGGTTITCNAGTTTTGGCAFFEFSGIGLTVDSTGTGKVNNGAACTTCAAVALTFANSSNHVVVQSAVTVGTGTFSAINQSFTLANDAFGDGFAFKINLTSPGTTPNWTLSVSGQYAASALSLYEVTAKPTMMPTVY